MFCPVLTSDHQLFVTLNRRSNEVRQSAQVVLARFPVDSFKIRLQTIDIGTNTIRRELRLVGVQNLNGLSLSLPLPFLDYVMLRNEGTVGRALQASYVDRLERFKGQLIRLGRETQTNDIMLVRLKTNNTFRRQVFSVRNDKMEVTNA